MGDRQLADRQGGGDGLPASPPCHGLRPIGGRPPHRRAVESAVQPRRSGRRTRLTPDVAERIVALVRDGAPLSVAAVGAGVPERTFWEWMSRGEGRDPQRPVTPLYAEFAQRVRQAEAEVHAKTVEVVYRAATAGEWRAAIAMLRLRWARYYAERLEVSGPAGGPVPQVHAQIAVQQEREWEPDKPFARQVIELLIAAGKLPPEVDPDVAADLLTAPAEGPVSSDADGPGRGAHDGCAGDSAAGG